MPNIYARAGAFERAVIPWKRGERYPLAASRVEVLGYRWKDTDPAWSGLGFAHAHIRDTSTMAVWICGKDAPYDHHLNVPFWHPANGVAPESPEMWYRVRPRRKGWRFFREEDGSWWLRYEPDYVMGPVDIATPAAGPVENEDG